MARSGYVNFQVQNYGQKMWAKIWRFCYNRMSFHAVVSNVSKHTTVTLTTRMATPEVLKLLHYWTVAVSPSSFCMLPVSLLLDERHDLCELLEF